MNRLYAICVLSILNSILFAATPDIDVLKYRVELRFDMERQTLTGHAFVTLRSVASSPLPAIALDLRGLQVDQARVNDIERQYVSDDSSVTILLPATLETGDTITIELFYHGVPTHESATMAGPVFDGYAFCRPQSHYTTYVAMTSHWMPCNTLFNDKALYDLTFIVPEGLRAASVGTLEEEEHDAEHARYRWVLHHPMPPEVIGWSVGEYIILEDEWDGLPVRYYMYPEDYRWAARYFTDIRWMVENLVERFGPYPGEKIGICRVPYGGVEVQDMILLGLDDHERFAAEVAMHELGHHWFGNSVTPMSLDENWLSEGFGMFCERLYFAYHKYAGDINTALAFTQRSYLGGIANAEGALPLRGYNRYINWNYCGTLYFKGAVVLNMLRNRMGNESFFEGLRAYTARYRYGNVTSEMFREHMEPYAGSSLSLFFDQWVYSAGWPQLLISRGPDGTGGTLTLRMRQVQGSKGWRLFELPLEIELVLRDKSKCRRSFTLSGVEDQLFCFDDLQAEDVTAWNLDPDYVNLVEEVDITAVDAAPAATEQPHIAGIWPQPVTAGTTARFRIDSPAASVTHIRLYDMLGREVRNISGGILPPGAHTLQLQTTGLSPGMYMLRLHAGEGMDQRAVIVR